MVSRRFSIFLFFFFLLIDRSAAQCGCGCGCDCCCCGGFNNDVNPVAVAPNVNGVNPANPNPANPNPNPGMAQTAPGVNRASVQRMSMGEYKKISEILYNEKPIRARRYNYDLSEVMNAEDNSQIDKQELGLEHDLGLRPVRPVKAPQLSLIGAVNPQQLPGAPFIPASSPKPPAAPAGRGAGRRFRLIPFPLFSCASR
ncbi:hypothetical protein M3Y99_01888000 [Aphelenchoides fujianensis]|nr:hypothetical protein M3Y99_01888000 [Aphelenchoides fujianensis]